MYTNTLNLTCHVSSVDASSRLTCRYLSRMATVRKRVSCRRWPARVNLNEPVDEDASHAAVDVRLVGETLGSDGIAALQLSHVLIDLIDVLTDQLRVVCVVLCLLSTDGQLPHLLRERLVSSLRTATRVHWSSLTGHWLSTQLFLMHHHNESIH